MNRNDRKSLILGITPSNQQSLLISRDEPVPHPQNIIDATMKRPLIAPKRISRFPQIDHPHLPISSPVAGHVLIGDTQSLDLLRERTGCSRAVESRISKTDVVGIGDDDKILLHAFETVDVAALG